MNTCPHGFNGLSSTVNPENDQQLADQVLIFLSYGTLHYKYHNLCPWSMQTYNTMTTPSILLGGKCHEAVWKMKLIKI